MVASIAEKDEHQYHRGGKMTRREQREGLWMP